MTSKKILILVLLAAYVCLLPNSVIANDPPVNDDKPTIAFVTNQIASFWNIAEVGANDPIPELD